MAAIPRQEEILLATTPFIRPMPGIIKPNDDPTAVAASTNPGERRFLSSFATSSAAADITGLTVTIATAGMYLVTFICAQVTAAGGGSGWFLVVNGATVESITPGTANQYGIVLPYEGTFTAGTIVKMQGGNDSATTSTFRLCEMVVEPI